MELTQIEIEESLVNELTRQVCNEVFNSKETYPTFILPNAYDVETAKKLHERAMSGFKNAFPQEYEEGLVKIENNIVNAKDGQQPPPLAPLNLQTTKPTKPAPPPTPTAAAGTKPTPAPTAPTAPTQPQNKNFGKVPYAQQSQQNQTSNPAQNQTQQNGRVNQPTASAAQGTQQAKPNTASTTIRLKQQPKTPVNEDVDWEGAPELKPKKWDTMSDNEKNDENERYRKMRKKLSDDFYKNKGAERSKRIDDLLTRKAQLKAYLATNSDSDMEKELEKTNKELEKEQRKQNLDKNIQKLNRYTIRFTANYNEDWYKRKFKHGLWNGLKWGLKNLWKWANSDAHTKYQGTDIEEITPADKKALVKINEEMMRKVANYYLTQFAGANVASQMLKTGAFTKLKDMLFGGNSRAKGTLIVQFRLAEDEGNTEGPEADAPEETTGEVKESVTPIKITRELMKENGNASKMLDKFLEEKFLK